MTKTDAEQHAVVYRLAEKFLAEKMQEAQLAGIETLTSIYLVQSYYAAFMSKGYSALAESINGADDVHSSKN